MKKGIDYSITAFVIICFAVSGVIILSLSILITQKDKELEYYKEESIREGVIIYVNAQGNTVSVIDPHTDKVIEVDVFDDIVLPNNIRVGDIAIYVIDYEETDADLLGIKRNN